MFAHRVAAVVVLLGAGLASAQTSPQLLTVFPPGARAGETVEVTFSGTGFDGDAKLLFSGPGFGYERVGKATASEPKAKQPPGQPAATAKFKVSVPEGHLGTFDVRVASKDGLSNPPRSWWMDCAR